VVTLDNITKSFHKYLYEKVNNTYYCHFSKLSVGDPFTAKLWIQPIWYNYPIFPICPNIIKMTLKCQSVIDEDPLLTNLRKMADFCVGIYGYFLPDPYITPTNIFDIFRWSGNTISNPTPITSAETFVKDVVELPIGQFDSIAVININVNILVCAC
jgi:hypothetical protein